MTERKSKVPQWAVELRNEIEEMYANGLTRKEICEQLGLTITKYNHHIRMLRQQNRCPVKRRPLTSRDAVFRNSGKIHMGAMRDIFVNCERGFIDWMRAQAEDGGYSTYAELLQDLLIDKYYQENGK